MKDIMLKQHKYIMMGRRFILIALFKFIIADSQDRMAIRCLQTTFNIIN